MTKTLIIGVFGIVKKHILNYQMIKTYIYNVLTGTLWMQTLKIFIIENI
jgi:hypothetical protein